ncbi:MAG: BBP7 family outer membrane beta-barrel protein [Thermoguttaceae bacterium]
MSFLIWTCLGGLLLAQNIPPSGLPSGLPDDLSDASPFFPCLGNLCGEQPPRCPWYGRADAVWLMRDRIDPVSLQTLGTLGDVVLSTDAINAPFRAGTQAVVGHNIGESRWQIDGTYLYMGIWDDAAAVRDSTSNGINTGNMFSPFSNFGQPPNNNGFDYNDFVSIREFSQLQSAELNLRYTVPMPHECLTAKLILGLRYLSVNEQFDYYSHSNVPVISPEIPTILGSAVSLTTLTKNDLFGPQIGGEFYFYAYPQCWIDLGIKGALCDNRALQDTNGNLVFGINGNAPVTSPLANRRGRDATAFVGDLDVELVWQLNRHIITRMGYQAIWINNLALASRNFDPQASILLNGPPQIDTIGRAVYHGPHIGLEVDW